MPQYRQSRRRQRPSAGCGRGRSPAGWWLAGRRLAGRAVLPQREQARTPVGDHHRERRRGGNRGCPVGLAASVGGRSGEKKTLPYREKDGGSGCARHHRCRFRAPARCRPEAGAPRRPRRFRGWGCAHVGRARRYRCEFRAPARCRSEASTGRTGRRSEPSTRAMPAGGERSLSGAVAVRRRRVGRGRR